MGNRLSKTVNGVPIGYTYDANDRMLAEGSKVFHYDANGNTIFADGMTLNYDFEDRLIGTNGGPGGPTQYAYDAGGSRIRRSVNGAVTSYLVDTLWGYGDVVEERDGLVGSLTARYEMGLDRVRMDRPGAGGGTRYFLFDGLGSVMGLTDGGGSLTDSWTYDAFGNPTRQSGTSINPFLFAGQQYDSAEGLYYNRARYYAPGQGRFLSQDPLMGQPGDPLSLHRYLYANADPVNHTDPTGQFSLTEEQTVAGLVNLTRQALDVASGSVRGMIEGGVYAFGKAAILQASYEDTIDFSVQAAQHGFILGALTGTLQKLLPFASNPFQIAGSATLGLLGGIGVKSQIEAIGEDWVNYAETGDESWSQAAAWDMAWGALALAGLRQSGCFIEGTNVSFVVSDTKPWLFNPETAPVGGDIKALVQAWQAGAVIWVPSKDEATGKVEWHKVDSAFEHTVNTLTTVELAKEGDPTGTVVETITGTPEHPFFTQRGQVPMGQLGIGTIIVTRAGPRLVVKSVKTVTYPEGVKVYNFTVEGTHTYFVGIAQGGVWVHNANCGQDVDDNNVTFDKPRQARSASSLRSKYGSGNVQVIHDTNTKTTTYSVTTNGTTYTATYDRNGHPDLTPYIYTGGPNRAQLPGGFRVNPKNKPADFAEADRQVGYNAANPRPGGYTWHHLPNGFDLILVETEAHRIFLHESY